MTKDQRGARGVGGPRKKADPKTRGGLSVALFYFLFLGKILFP